MEEYLALRQKRTNPPPSAPPPALPKPVPSLIFLASQCIRDNLDAFEHLLSHIPDELLDKLLVGCSATHLLKIEQYACRDLSEVTEDLWRLHCRNFLNSPDYVNDSCPTWKELYMDLTVRYEKKKVETGKHLRSLYEEEAKAKESKKIKVISGNGANGRSRPKSSFTGRAGGSSFAGRPGSLMEKCLKDMKKSPAMISWNKKPTVTVSKLTNPLRHVQQPVSKGIGTPLITLPNFAVAKPTQSRLCSTRAPKVSMPNSNNPVNASLPRAPPTISSLPKNISSTTLTSTQFSSHKR